MVSDLRFAGRRRTGGLKPPAHNAPGIQTLFNVQRYWVRLQEPYRAILEVVDEFAIVLGLQHSAATASPLVSQTPHAACPASTCPAATARPWAGGYFDIYVGCTRMCMRSKCSHSGWGALVMRPWANVSAANR